MLELIVHAGDLTRRPSLVTVPVPAARLLESGALKPGPIADQLEGGTVFLQDDAGGTKPTVAQYDSTREELVFVLTGGVEAGSSRRLRVLESPDDDGDAPYPVTLTQKLDRVIFMVAGKPFATYNTLGARRPYFWPVIGPSGASVIRGQGTAEHPHHTGMGINYGGHSEGGSTNIWSDWDEPPYGPGGRMLHRGFRRLSSGPVYGELVQDLTYVNTYGDPIVDEVRTIRCWWASNEARFFDVQVEVLSARDRGPQPF
ncbi:MAG TPA: DUF6807 family protein, partial [Chloroflexota bacterium]|nr:DUF6807 family protein [Chloroflexota bacterium]